MVEQFQILSRRLRYAGPQTDDELHAWIKRETGFDIPRVKVCADHDPPFKLISDVYFERLSVTLASGEVVNVNSVLVLANRAGFKTTIVAVIHYINAIYKPGCGGLQFGASEAQGRRCYENIDNWCYEKDPATGRRTEKVKDFILEKPMKSETKFKSGSSIEVVAGSVKAVSGPHSQKTGADEVDQMEDELWEQSRGISSSKTATGPLPPFMEAYDGMIPPQDIITSTRNSRHGLMQQLIDEHHDAVKNNNIPMAQLIQWCIWETIKEVPNCRGVEEEDRKKRLKELGRDPCELCQCDRVKKGHNKDGSDRTLEQVCGGKAFRSRGQKPYIDLVATFQRMTPGTWLLQAECREGRDENNYIEDWSLEFYGIRHYEPRPEYGPIYQGIDWGGTNPYCSLWFQYTQSEVEAYDFEYNPIYINPGVYVLFKEVYMASSDDSKFARRVIDTEDKFRKEYGRRWNVAGRYADPQGKSGRNLFARKGMPTKWPVKTRDKEYMISLVQNIVVDDRMAVDVENATMFTEEVEQWAKNPRTGKEIDEFNHAMAAWRYCLSNAEIFHGDDAAGQNNQVQDDKPPVAVSDEKPENPRTVRIKGNGLKRRNQVQLDNTTHPTSQFMEMLK